MLRLLRAFVLSTPWKIADGDFAKVLNFRRLYKHVIYYCLDINDAKLETVQKSFRERRLVNLSCHH